jgi:hypothetical protein
MRQGWAGTREVGLVEPDARREFPIGNDFQFPMDFGIWQDFEICTRRFWRNFDMRIFPKFF